MERLVRWGRLEFTDFARLDPAALRPLLDPADPEWRAALNNTPQVWRQVPSDQLRRVIGRAEPQERHPRLPDIRAAQDRLVRRHWRELLIAKAPALYDALPWHDVDLGPVVRGRRPWQTRFLLAGGHSSVTACRLRRTAGVYVVEDNPVMAAYTERKAGLEKVKNLRIVRAGLSGIALPSRAADLAIIGLEAVLALAELERVAAEVVLLECDPLSELDPGPLQARGYRRAAIATRLGPATAWVRPPAA